MKASVVMTVKNEPVDRLARSIRALASQPDAEQLELLVAAPPGESAVAAVTGLWPGTLVLVDNPSGRRSPGLNSAVAASQGSVICRVDARSVVPPQYVDSCMARLASDPAIGVVGGMQRPHPGGDGAVARGIARALRNPWALGGASYRRRGAEGAVDTVYLGAWRRDELAEIGGFNEQIDANEDYDLCQRFRAAGFKVWLEPRLEIEYEARASLPALWRQYRAFGRAKARYWTQTGSRPIGRQRGALFFAALIVFLVAGCIGRRSRPIAALAAAAACGLGALDHAADQSGAASERAVASICYVVVGGAWVFGVLEGVVTEALRRCK